MFRVFKSAQEHTVSEHTEALIAAEYALARERQLKPDETATNAVDGSQNNSTSG